MKYGYLLKLCLLFAIGFSLIYLLSTFGNHRVSGRYSKSPPRIFCMILTTPYSFKSGRMLAQLSTWVTRCSNYRFVSVLPDSVKADLKSKGLLVNQVPEPLNLYQPHGWEHETYMQLTLKVFTIFLDVYKEFNTEDYDFYLKADDDTFVNMVNLEEFLSAKDPEFAATYGYDFKFVIEKGYPAGGPGYVLSRKAFRSLGEQLNANMSFCPNNGVEDMSSFHI
jgi:hypothetical protein